MPRVAPSIRRADQSSVLAARRWLAESSFPGALIVPTELGLKKDYFDATEEVRDFLKSAGLHDYDRQLQGEDHKVLLPGFWAGPARRQSAEIALYRPKTTKRGRRPGGDPRIRISGAKRFVQPNNVLVLLAHGPALMVINWSDRATREYVIKNDISTSSDSGTPLAGGSPPTFATDVLGTEIRDAEQQPDDVLLARYGAKLDQLMNPVRQDGSHAPPFKRSAEVVVLSLRRARYKCEVPGCTSELFTRINGSVYLEVHHLRTLAEGGPDTLDNTAALCPSHHREVHHGGRAGALLRVLKQKRQPTLSG